MTLERASKAIVVGACLFAGALFAADKPDADKLKDLPVLHNADLVRALRKVFEGEKTALQRDLALKALYGRKADLSGEVRLVHSQQRDKCVSVLILVNQSKTFVKVEAWIPVEAAAKLKMGQALRIACTIKVIEVESIPLFEDKDRAPLVRVTFESIR